MLQYWYQNKATASLIIIFYFGMNLFSGCWENRIFDENLVFKAEILKHLVALWLQIWAKFFYIQVKFQGASFSFPNSQIQSLITPPILIHLRADRVYYVEDIKSFWMRSKFPHKTEFGWWVGGIGEILFQAPFLGASRLWWWSAQIIWPLQITQFTRFRATLNVLRILLNSASKTLRGVCAVARPSL